MMTTGSSPMLAALLILPYGLVMWATWPLGDILGNRAARLPALPPWAERATHAAIAIRQRSAGVAEGAQPLSERVVDAPHRRRSA